MAKIRTHDQGHKETDTVLLNLEKRLRREYEQAYKEISKKANDYFDKFAERDKRQRALVESGGLSAADYKRWRRNQMLSGKRWTDLRDYLAEDLTNTNAIAMAMVRDELPDVFAINANYTEYEIENGLRTNYGFTLYSRETVENLIKDNRDLLPAPTVDIAKDLRWNKQHIQSAITQGVLQGESAANVAKRLQTVANMDAAAAMRSARTAVTGAQNAGRQFVYDRAAEMGLPLKKEWMATRDNRTRHEHGVADGQIVGLKQPFVIGGYNMKYPGDTSAPGHLVYNCRCTTVTVEAEHITKGTEPRKTWAEWKAERGSVK